jgi:hypothetical protein
MSDLRQAAECRLLELLADRAVFGLEDTERTELAQLLKIMPHADMECMERAAAVVELAWAEVEPLPAGVAARIRAAALWHLRLPSR